MAQVKAEYDFQSQPNTGELSISAGEVLTVIREVRGFLSRWNRVVRGFFES